MKLLTSKETLYSIKKIKEKFGNCILTKFPHYDKIDISNMELKDSLSYFTFFLNTSFNIKEMNLKNTQLSEEDIKVRTDSLQENSSLIKNKSEKK